MTDCSSEGFLYELKIMMNTVFNMGFYLYFIIFVFVFALKQKQIDKVMVDNRPQCLNIYWRYLFIIATLP